MKSCAHTRLFSVSRREKNLILQKTDRLEAILRYETIFPSLIVLIGNVSKSIVINELTSKRRKAVLRPPGEIHVRISSHSGRPIVFADGDLRQGLALSDRRMLSCHEMSEWVIPGGSASDIEHDIYHRILQPFAETFCLFAADLGGLTSIANQVASWLNKPLASSVPSQIYPQLCIVVEGIRPAHENETERSFLRMVGQKSSQHLSKMFSGFRIIALPVYGVRRSVRYSYLIEELMGASEAVRSRRRHLQYLLSPSHFCAFIHEICVHYVSGSSLTFDFILKSRLNYPQRGHIASFMSCLSSIQMFLEFGASLLGSYFLLSCYQPDAPSKLIV
jgi:hypothetical protein